MKSKKRPGLIQTMMASQAAAQRHLRAIGGYEIPGHGHPRQEKHAKSFAFRKHGRS